jgi:hypothetical protein
MRELLSLVNYFMILLILLILFTIYTEPTHPLRGCVGDICGHGRTASGKNPIMHLAPEVDALSLVSLKKTPRQVRLDSGLCPSLHATHCLACPSISKS